MHLLIVTLSVAQCSCNLIADVFKALCSTISVHDGLSYLTMSECSDMCSGHPSDILVVREPTTLVGEGDIDEDLDRESE